MTNFAMTLEALVTLLSVFNVTQLCIVPELTWAQLPNLPAFKSILLPTHLARDTQSLVQRTLTCVQTSFLNSHEKSHWW